MRKFITAIFATVALSASPPAAASISPARSEARAKDCEKLEIAKGGAGIMAAANHIQQSVDSQGYANIGSVSLHPEVSRIIQTCHGSTLSELSRRIAVTKINTGLLAFAHGEWVRMTIGRSTFGMAFTQDVENFLNRASVRADPIGFGRRVMWDKPGGAVAADGASYDWRVYIDEETVSVNGRTETPRRDRINGASIFSIGWETYAFQNLAPFNRISPLDDAAKQRAVLAAFLMAQYYHLTDLLIESRNKASADHDPLGLYEANRDGGLWLAIDAIEANRPVIQTRKLSGTESKQIDLLLQEYGASRSAETYQQLHNLARSGDFKAMLAIRSALGMGLPVGEAASRAERETASTIASVLSAQWTVKIWERHGFELAGMKHIELCGDMKKLNEYLARDTGNEDFKFSTDDAASVYEFKSSAQMFTLYNNCGFRLTFFADTKFRSSNFSFKAAIFGQKHRVLVEENPLSGDYLYNEAKFDKIDVGRSSVEFASRHLVNNLPIDPVSKMHYAWYYEMAAQSGRTYLVNRDDSKNIAYVHAAPEREAAYRRRLAEEQSQKERQRHANTTAWAELIRDVSRTDVDLSFLELSIRLGESAVDDYAKFRPELATDIYIQACDRMSTPYRQAEICSKSVTTGVVSTATSSSITSAYGGSSYSNQPVEIRNYDSNGTYTGSTQTSAVWADIIKMTSSPPR